MDADHKTCGTCAHFHGRHCYRYPPQVIASVRSIPATGATRASVYSEPAMKRPPVQESERACGEHRTPSQEQDKEGRRQ